MFLWAQCERQEKLGLFLMMKLFLSFNQMKQQSDRWYMLLLWFHVILSKQKFVVGSLSFSCIPVGVLQPFQFIFYANIFAKLLSLIEPNVLFANTHRPLINLGTALFELRETKSWDHLHLVQQPYF